MDVFSKQGDQIELISFRLTYFEEPQKIFVYEKKLFPDVLLYIGHHIRYLM
jgi:hypothetical protein